MEIIINIVGDILKQPALLLGLVTLIGLLVLKKPMSKVVSGSLVVVTGYMLVSVGIVVIVEMLDLLASMFMSAFRIEGIKPNNGAIATVAETILCIETLSILILGYIINVFVARFTLYKYIFLTGYQSYLMACLLSMLLQSFGFEGTMLVLIGGFFLGTWSAISPAIGQRYTLKVSNGENIAIGHFNSIGYFISAYVGGLVGKESKTQDTAKAPNLLQVFYNTSLLIGLIMIVIFIIAISFVGPQFMTQYATFSTNPYIYATISGVKFAIGFAIVFAGIHMILDDLLVAFKGIAKKIIPNAIPAVDSTLFFAYAPDVVLVGFISSFIGGILGMKILGLTQLNLIIPSLVFHFFCGATAAIYGKATGGIKGAFVGSFMNGLLLSFLPALLVNVLGNIGLSDLTLGNTDFALFGITLNNLGDLFGSMGIFILMAITILVLILPNVLNSSQKVINN